MTLLSHLDEKGRPTMVDVGSKGVTRREALAQAVVRLPMEVFSHLKDGEIASKKGPVFQTAILAGIMAAKKTSDLIPLCHPLPLEVCKVTIETHADRKEAVIHCRVACHHRTGVEMEALTGASIAALTLYDMCKALSHHIVIGEIRLLEKTGGKADYFDPVSSREGATEESSPAAATPRDPAD